MNKLLHLVIANKARTPKVPGLVVHNAASDTTDVYVYGPIMDDELDAEWVGGVAGVTLAKEIRGLKGAVNLRINSPGGSVFAAQAVVAAIRDSKANITAHIDSLAASAATIIASAAPKVVMHEGAMYMIHRGMTFGFGNTNDFASIADLLSKTDGVIASGYAARTGMPVEDVVGLMDAETWFTADEALEHKFIDEVVKPEKPVKNTWDLSVYAKAPKLEPAPVEPSPEPAAVSASEIEHRERQGQRLCYLLRAAPK